MQAVDYFLVNGPDTPLRLFSPTFVTNMTDAALQEVAGEELRVKRQRDDLEREITLLGRARVILQ